MPIDPEPMSGGDDRFDFRRHGLSHQVRTRIAVALTTMARPLKSELNRPNGPRWAGSIETIVERIIVALAPFDVRWRGDTSDDPHALPPETRRIADAVRSREEPRS